MKAVVSQGPRQITVEERPDTRIQSPADAIIQLTATNIGGKIVGHENTGVVAEVGAAVERIRVGDRASVPFNIAYLRVPYADFNLAVHGAGPVGRATRSSRSSTRPTAAAPTAASRRSATGRTTRPAR